MSSDTTGVTHRSQGLPFQSFLPRPGPFSQGPESFSQEPRPSFEHEPFSRPSGHFDTIPSQQDTFNRAPNRHQDIKPPPFQPPLRPHFPFAPEPVKPEGNCLVRWYRNFVPKEREFTLVFGVFLLVLLNIVPICGAIELLCNEVFTYIVGDTVPILVLVCCFGVILFYTVAILVFFSCAREEEKSESTLMLIFLLTALLLGCSCLFLYYEFDSAYGDVVDEFENICTVGSTSGPLYEEYVALLTLRKTTGCSEKISVTQCDGYNDTFPDTSIMEYIEPHYMCSGYCDTISTEGSATGTTEFSRVTRTSKRTRWPRLGSNSLYLAHNKSSNGWWPDANALSDFFYSLSTKRKRNAMRAKRKGMVVENLSAIKDASLSKSVSDQEIQETVLGSTVSLGNDYTYPLTLFSLANYQASCTAMIIDDLTYNAEKLGYFLYVMGLAIIVGALIIQLFIFVMLCAGGDGSKEERSSLLGRRRHHRNRDKQTTV